MLNRMGVQLPHAAVLVPTSTKFTAVGADPLRFCQEWAFNHRSDEIRGFPIDIVRLCIYYEVSIHE
jgi:hypothetical protein